jgi:hypothetical protein
MTKKVLSIVDCAYRATLEEQDDTILWLNHMLHTSGLDVTILLRANAVNYAVRGQDASGLRVGDWEVAHPPMLDADISGLLDKGVPVYYVSDDAVERGVSEGRVIDGAKPISRRELPSLLAGYQNVWQW